MGLFNVLKVLKSNPRKATKGYVNYFDKDGKLQRIDSDGTVSEVGGGVVVKRYKALISQTGSDAPTAVVSENTLGNITTYYDEPGSYCFNTETDVLIQNKTFMHMQKLKESVSTKSDIFWNSENEFCVQTSGDDKLNYTSILVEVYP